MWPPSGALLCLLLRVLLVRVRRALLSLQGALGFLESALYLRYVNFLIVFVLIVMRASSVENKQNKADA